MLCCKETLRAAKLSSHRFRKLSAPMPDPHPRCHSRIPGANSSNVELYCPRCAKTNSPGAINYITAYSFFPSPASYCWMWRSQALSGFMQSMLWPHVFLGGGGVATPS